MKSILGSPLLAPGVLCLACIVAHSQTAQPVPPSAEREAHWRQDIKFMVDGLGATGRTVDFQHGITTRGQIDFLKLYPPGPFNDAVQSLEADISKLSDAEIVLQLDGYRGRAEMIFGQAVGQGARRTNRRPGRKQTSVRVTRNHEHHRLS